MTDVDILTLQIILKFRDIRKSFGNRPAALSDLLRPELASDLSVSAY